MSISIIGTAGRQYDFTRPLFDKMVNKTLELLTPYGLNVPIHSGGAAGSDEYTCIF